MYTPTTPSLSLFQIKLEKKIPARVVSQFHRYLAREERDYEIATGGEQDTLSEGEKRGNPAARTSHIGSEAPVPPRIRPTKKLALRKRGEETFLDVCRGDDRNYR